MTDWAANEKTTQQKKKKPITVGVGAEENIAGGEKGRGDLLGLLVLGIAP